MKTKNWCLKKFSFVTFILFKDLTQIFTNFVHSTLVEPGLSQPGLERPSPTSLKLA